MHTYTPLRLSIFSILVLFLLFSCGDNAQEGYSDTGEDNSKKAEISLRLDTTIWTDQLELFLDYPALIAGQEGKLAAHFTLLDGHRPIETARVYLQLTGQGQRIETQAEEATSSGIYLLPIQPVEPGIYKMQFRVESSEFTGEIPAGKIRVFDSEENAIRALSNMPKSEPEISFSKEQAWQIDFQTIQVDTSEIYESLELVGRWMPVPGKERSLNAGGSGNVLYEISDMVEGMEVRKGQVLMRISGEDLNVSSIEAEARKAKAQLDQAKSEYERKQELHDLQIIPDAEFEEVAKRYEVAKANFQQLSRNFGRGGIVIRAPISGYIKNIYVENGTFVNSGGALLTIGSKISSMIKAASPPQHREFLQKSNKSWISVDGRLQPVNARVVSVGNRVTAKEPLLPVFIEVNDVVDALEGRMVELQLGKSTGRKSLVIPRSALLEDFGKYKVVVQTAGEAYEMRHVQPGNFQGDQVAILNGLEAGEWIVSQGAYQVKMASMAGAAPAHGHSH